MTELWNWRIDGRIGPARIGAVLADLLGSPVSPIDPLAVDQLPAGGLLVDVWYAPGAFPTAVDCYGPPEDCDELPVLAEVARRLNRGCLLPDDTLDAGRHLLCAPEGTIRPVHLDVTDGYAGARLSNMRRCTTASPRCRSWASCHRSRWAPDSVLVPAAAA